MSDREFPVDFLWGASTAAYQIEGGLFGNDWFDWEASGGGAEPCGVGIDHWSRWPEDQAWLARLGHTSHRMSVEWSRLEPTMGHFDDAAFARYAMMIEGLLSHGITPMVTIQHVTLPRWFAARGGWLGPHAVELFARYAGEVGRRLGHLAPLLATLNEPQMTAVNGYLLGKHPPQHADPQDAERVNQVLMRGHRAAVSALRRTAPSSQVGVCLQLPVVEPADPEDRQHVRAAARSRDLLVDSHLADLRAGGDVGDWIGVQYYTRARVLADGSMAPPLPGTETTAMGWEVYPKGLGEVLRSASTVGLPLFVTENGIATDDDTQRERYLLEHLSQVAIAIADGVDIRGYFHWSAFDNFEWAEGYRPRFGLIAIDRNNRLNRAPRPSALLYQNIINAGRLPTTDSFRPRLPDTVER